MTNTHKEIIIRIIVSYIEKENSTVVISPCLIKFSDTGKFTYNWSVKKGLPNLTFYEIIQSVTFVFMYFKSLFFIFWIFHKYCEEKSETFTEF